MHARTRLIRIQRGMYRRLRQYARAFLGNLSPGLKKYYLEYLRDFQDFKSISAKRDLLEAAQGAHLVLCGDYHTLAQAQRTVLRLLRECVPQAGKRQVILALEMLHASDNAKARDFLDGKMDEEAFLKATAFHRKWGFNWENYRELFEFAREHKLPVTGINLARKSGAPTLKQRDVFAAKVLADLSVAEPDAWIFVLIGDLHLATAHLPAELEKQFLKRSLKRTWLVIHQNSERFYWKLVDKGLEQLVDVVLMRPGVYCVMSTPPWVKLQSHVKWNEILAEEMYPDELSPDTVDHADEIKEWIEIIARFIGVEPKGKSDFQDFQIQGPLDYGFLEHLERSGNYTKPQIRFLAKALAEFGNYFIPGENILFLSSLSVNHAAELSAIYLHAKLSGAKHWFEDPLRDFYPMVWVEALGFLGSKIINHKRKCNGPRDLDVMAHTKPSRERGQREAVAAARLALHHLREEERAKKARDHKFTQVRFRTSDAGTDRTLLYHKVAKLLGQLLGHGLYGAVMNNSVSRDEIRALFAHAFPSGDETTRLYFEWVERLDQGRFRNVTKSDSL